MDLGSVLRTQQKLEGCRKKTKEQIEIMGHS